MQIVIDIPEEVKKAFDNANKDDINGCFYDYNSVIGKAIKNGTPLPKGHGRLIDRDKVSAKAMLYAPRDFDGLFMNVQDFRNAPTIIEADEEVDE